MATTLNQYAVRYDDTLQTIAAQQLGDTTRWTDIVALNHLRSPYISPVLPDQFGGLQGQYPLQTPLAQGATTLPWNTGTAGYASSAALLVVGAILVLTVPQSDGTLLYDAAQISAVTKSFDPGTGASSRTLTLLPVVKYSSLSGQMTTAVGGMQRAHSAGETLQIYGNPTLLSTAVAQPGDLISLPQVTLDQTGLVQPGTLDALGTDALLDQNGQKQVGPNGDVALVSGSTNVAQALRIRINTTPGELSQHLDYGCQIQFYVGAAQESYWPDLATALIHDCVLQDARVQDVANMQFQQVGDTDFIDLQVAINNGGQVLSASVPVPQ